MIYINKYIYIGIATGLRRAEHNSLSAFFGDSK